MPLRVAGSQILYLGSSSRLDASAAFALEQMTELKVESGVVEGALYESARHGLLACEGIEAKLETVDDKDAMAARITAILEQRQPMRSEPISTGRRGTGVSRTSSPNVTKPRYRRGFGRPRSS